MLPRVDDSGIPAPSREEKLAAFRAGFKEANRVGLARVQQREWATVMPTEISRTRACSMICARTAI